MQKRIFYISGASVHCLRKMLTQSHQKGAQCSWATSTLKRQISFMKLHHILRKSANKVFHSFQLGGYPSGDCIGAGKMEWWSHICKNGNQLRWDMPTTLKIMTSDRSDPMVMDDLGFCCFQKQSELILAMHAPGILLHQWPQYHQLLTNYYHACTWLFPYCNMLCVTATCHHMSSAVQHWAIVDFWLRVLIPCRPCTGLMQR